MVLVEIHSRRGLIYCGLRDKHRVLFIRASLLSDRLEREPVRVDSTETSWLLSVGRECVGWSMETVDARLDTVCPSPTLLIDELRSAPESPLAIRELRAEGLPYGERGCRGRCRPNVDQGEDVDA